MDTQMVFRRCEQKYLLTQAKRDLLLSAMGPYMKMDEHGRATIRNVYLDTDNYRLIRRSIEKPVYKEKLRLRSYKKTLPGEAVFVELKKKYKRVVFKRRVLLPEPAALDWLCHGQTAPLDTQITREIEYFRDLYGSLRPALFLAYEREAYLDRNGGDLRVTFDEDIRARTTGSSTGLGDEGEPLRMGGAVLMEIKTAGGIPLWLARLLSEQKLYCAPFSKYGAAYREIVYPKERYRYGGSCVSRAL